jgi:hypothetical protein
MKRSYPAMAAALDLEFCRGIDKVGIYCPLDHGRWGAAEPGRVHMADVRVTKAGLARFLGHAAVALQPELNDEPPWRRVYRRQIAARELAAKLHVRMPGREFYSFDRSFVLASVASIPNSEPLRKQAFDWARR